jgi:hypothetical protein
MFTENCSKWAGVDMVPVPFRGAPPAVTDLIGGRVQVVFDTFAASIEFVRAGKLRALAVTTATRSPALPDVPSLNDFLPGYDASTWLGIGAPKNTPPISSRNSTRRSMLFSPIPRWKRWKQAGVGRVAYRVDYGDPRGGCCDDGFHGLMRGYRPWRQYAQSLGGMARHGRAR